MTLGSDGALIKDYGYHSQTGDVLNLPPKRLVAASWDEYVGLLGTSGAVAARETAARAVQREAEFRAAAAEAAQREADADAAAEYEAWEAEVEQRQQAMAQNSVGHLVQGLQNYASHNNELDRIARQGQARVAELVAERQRPQSGGGGGGSTYNAPRSDTPSAAAPAQGAPARSTAAQKPIRFMITSIYDSAKANNRVCYSNIVTVPHPGEWGKFDEGSWVYEQYGDQFRRACADRGARLLDQYFDRGRVVIETDGPNGVDVDDARSRTAGQPGNVAVNLN